MTTAPHDVQPQDSAASAGGLTAPLWISLLVAVELAITALTLLL